MGNNSNRKQKFSSGIPEENVEERAQANHLFELLDRDDDQRLEFCDTMLFIFSMDEGSNTQYG